MLNNRMRRIVVLRPGALGDVLAVRSALGALRQAAPSAELVLLAPGARGRLLMQFGLADRWIDLDRSECAWLFGDGRSGPPAVLVDAVCDADAAICYLARDDSTTRARLTDLVCRQVLMHPDRPPEGAGLHINDHLSLAVTACIAPGSNGPAPVPDLVLPGERIAAACAAMAVKPGTYAVVHPGSGSLRKNWPVEHFRAVVASLTQAMPVIVTAGEADGDLLAQVDPQGLARALLLPSLETLAALLAGAALYLGNDSGVSHLAGSVRSADGQKPRCTVLFGSTDPLVWAPAHAEVLCAPQGDLGRLQPATVLQALIRGIPNTMADRNG